MTDKLPEHDYSDCLLQTAARGAITRCDMISTTFIPTALGRHTEEQHDEFGSLFHDWPYAARGHERNVRE